MGSVDDDPFLGGGIGAHPLRNLDMAAQDRRNRVSFGHHDGQGDKFELFEGFSSVFIFESNFISVFIFQYFTYVFTFEY